MIFVTVGTQKQSFSRLFDMISNSKELENEKIIAQCGNLKLKNSKNITFYDYISQDKIEENIKKADIIICHGGVGTIFLALNLGKKVIACPRYKKYKEHVDDHQLEICETLEKEGYILTCLDLESLDEKIKKIKNCNLKPYKRCTKYLNVLRNEI